MDRENTGIVKDGNEHVVFVNGEVVGSCETREAAIDLLDSYEIDRIAAGCR